MNQFLRTRLHSFRHAFSGFQRVFLTQRNAWIHSVIALIAFLAAFWLGLPARDWAVIVLTAALVFTAEFLNTAIEAVVDLASPAQHDLAGAAKDISAAAVLITALAAILMGLLILGPPLWDKLFS
jgi:diacylglycerol kinase